MRHARIRRWSARLCLVAAIWIGIAPANAFVLCLEPDGCIALELAADAGSCQSCDDHPGDARSPASTVLSSEQGCACLDLLVTSGRDDLRPIHRIARHPAACSVAQALPLEPLPVCARLGSRLDVRSDPPRPSRSLTLLRSVVLRV